jgi:segregation and condensation protein A
VREHMTGILRLLAGGAFREFGELFDPLRGIAVLVVNFLAVLELAREGLIEVTHGQPYAPIYVRIAAGAAVEAPGTP